MAEAGAYWRGRILPDAAKYLFAPENRALLEDVLAARFRYRPSDPAWLEGDDLQGLCVVRSGYGKNRSKRALAASATWAGIATGPGLPVMYFIWAGSSKEEHVVYFKTLKKAKGMCPP